MSEGSQSKCVYACLSKCGRVQVGVSIEVWACPSGAPGRVSMRGARKNSKRVLAGTLLVSPLLGNRTCLNIPS